MFEKEFGNGIREHIDLTSEGDDTTLVRPYWQEIDDEATTSPYFGPSRAAAAAAAAAGDPRSKGDSPRGKLDSGAFTHKPSSSSTEVTAADLFKHAMERVEARRFRKSSNPPRKTAEQDQPKKPRDLVQRVRKPKISLSPDQTRVLQLVLEGKNVFFTGPAGSGKSLILEHVKYHLSKQKKDYRITAPTGVAAAQLGGSTIHSFSGVGLGDKGLREYVGMSTRNWTKIGEKRQSWRSTEVLIIDEISMVRDYL